jgi:hypothetical protein
MTSSGDAGVRAVYSDPISGSASAICHLLFGGGGSFLIRAIGLYVGPSRIRGNGAQEGNLRAEDCGFQVGHRIDRGPEIG